MPASRSARTHGGRRAPEAGRRQRVARHSRPDTARLLISAVDREQIRASLLADRDAYSRANDAAFRALIDAALKRLDTPDYGYCITCGIRIATTHLLEMPYAEQCLVCAAVHAA